MLADQNVHATLRVKLLLFLSHHKGSYEKYFAL